MRKNLMLMLLGILLVTFQLSAQMTWTVDDDGGAGFINIQEAINVASPGDIILVAPGIYYGRVLIDKSLTLLGAQAGVDARGRSGDESIIDGNSVSGNFYLVDIRADNVILDGFTITHPLFNGRADASGVLTHIGGRKQNIRITNCIIHDIGTETRSPVDFGSFGINSGPVDGLEIDHNVIHNIKNNDTTGSWANAIIVWGNNSTVTANNINIHDNEFYDIESPATYDEGVFISSFCTDVTINRNTFTNCGEYAISNNSVTSSALTITNNDISGSSIAGIRCRDKADTITGNMISGCDIGIWVRAEAEEAPTVQYNDISGNSSYGLENSNTSFVVNALYNWWGDSSGPLDPLNADGLNQYNPLGWGDAVTEYVLYDPWIGQGGFITGGGTIWSEAGYYRRDTDAVGQANFGFVSRYKKGANTPEGHTNFVFDAGGLHFRSSEYDWLVVAGTIAKFKGVGTIDDASGIYKFIIWASDDDLDTFRIKIWEEVNGFDDVVYDNGSKQVITGGNIFIHKEKKK